MTEKPKNALIELTEQPYSLLKVQQFFESIKDKVLKAFTAQRMQKYISITSKSLYQQQLTAQILKQLRKYARDLTSKQFKKMFENNNFKDALQFYDYLYFRIKIMNEIDKDPWDQFDQEYQFYNQIEDQLLRIQDQL